MLEAVGSIYYLFNDLVFFFALFIVQTRSNVMKKTIVVLVCIKREA